MKIQTYAAFMALALSTVASAETTVYLPNAMCINDVMVACYKDDPTRENICKEQGGEWVSPAYGDRYCEKKSGLSQWTLCEAYAKAQGCYTEMKLPDSADQKAMLDKFREENDDRLKAILKVLNESGAVVSHSTSHPDSVQTPAPSKAKL